MRKYNITNLTPDEFDRIRNAVIKEYWNWYHIMNDKRMYEGLTKKQKQWHKELSQDELEEISKLTVKLSKILFGNTKTKKKES